MSCKDAFDVFFKFLALITGSVAFGIGLYQWKRSQDWQRAAKLDDMVKEFQELPLLRLAVTAIDYSRRTTKFQDKKFHISNKDAILALQDHKKMGRDPVFTDEQAALRDAYDALLSFFIRLEIAITGGLIEAGHAKAAFGYYFERFTTFNMHPNKDGLLDGASPSDLVAGYIEAYGDPESCKRLSKHFL